MDSDSPAVVLVRPHLSSNLGSVARVVKNFGLHDLRLVEPAAPADEDAHRLASGADDVLAASRRFSDFLFSVADFEIVVTTSSLRGRDRHRELDLSQLPGFLREAGRAPRLAFVFGPEKSGLTQEELARASATLTIPTQASFPTMNLSHAVAVVLATALLWREHRPDELSPRWAPAHEVEGMIAHWDRALDAIGFYDTGHRGRTLLDWRRLVAIAHWDRALDAIGFYDTGHRGRTLLDWRRLVAGRPLAERDVAILRGVANRILVALKRSSRLSAQGSQPEDTIPKER